MLAYVMEQSNGASLRTQLVGGRFGADNVAFEHEPAGNERDRGGAVAAQKITVCSPKSKRSEALIPDGTDIE
jgi:hypothetical protein